MTASAPETAQGLADQLSADDADFLGLGIAEILVLSGIDPNERSQAFVEALGIDPERAVAIEDSPTGVRAAVSAGLVTVGVPLMVSLVGAGAHELWPSLAGRTPTDLAGVHARTRTLAEGRR